MTSTDSTFSSLLHELMADFAAPGMALQWVLIVVALLLGFALTYGLRLWFYRLRPAQVRQVGNPNPASTQDSTPIQSVAQSAANLGVMSLKRVLMPLLASLLLWLAKRTVLHNQPQGLVKLAITLFLCWALIRLALYVLRRLFQGRAHPVLLVWIERIVAVLVWLAVAAHITAWDDVILATLAEVTLPIGVKGISLLALLQGALSVLITLLLALWAGAAIEERLLNTASLDSSLRVVLGRVARALLIVVALLSSLAFVGFDLTVLSVFGGALGVGLGLGLQRIASNYVSGFIILLDRSLRIGDMLMVDKHYGEVTQIKTRYTVLRALDGTEALLPNEMLVSNPVQNYSYSDKKIKLSTKIVIAYKSDVEATLLLMESTAAGVARVLTDPKPMALLTQFAADGLEIELNFWMSDPENGRGNLISDVNRAIWNALVQAKVEIPYPQREIRILNQT